MSPWLVCLLQSAYAAETFQGFTWYVGDLHAHTGASGDGASSDLGRCRGECGALADLGQLARDAGLDFLAVSDHSNGSNAASVQDFDASLQTLLNAEDPEAGFVVIPSAEVWFQTPSGKRLGHRNPLLFGDTETLRGLAVTDLQPGGTTALGRVECEDIWTWMEGLNARFGPALLIPHHPAVLEPMSVDWTCHSPTWEPAVEVYSRHGSSMGDGLSMDPAWSGTDPKGAVHYALSAEGGALELGFLGGTDSHDTEPGEVCDLDSMHGNHPYGGGLTLVVLPEDEPFTRQAIYTAIVERRTIATTGPALPVQVDYLSGGAWLGGLGQTLELPSGQPLDVQVGVPNELSAHVLDISLVGPAGSVPFQADGGGQWSVSVDAEDVPAWLYVRVTVAGDTWYGDPGCNDGGPATTELLWLSPSWIEEGTPDLDGDGVSWADGDCDDGDPDRSPNLDEVCTGGVDEDCNGRVDDEDSACREVEQPAVVTGGRATSSTAPARAPGVSQPGRAWTTWTAPHRPATSCAAVARPGWLGALLALALLRRRST